MSSQQIRNIYNELEYRLCNSLRNQEDAKAYVLKETLQFIAQYLPQTIELAEDEKQLVREDFYRCIDRVSARTGATEKEAIEAVLKYVNKEGLTANRGLSTPKTVLFYTKE